MRIHPINSTNNIVEMTNEIVINNNNNNNMDNNEHLCSICLISVSSENKFLECNHLFHPECIIRWFQRQKYNHYIPSCPYCKDNYDEIGFTNKIILYHINCIQNYIEKLKFVLKKGLISYIQRKRIKNLLKIYIKLINVIKNDQKNNGNQLDNSNFFTCDIMPLPPDIIRLILLTEKEVTEEENEKKREKLSKKEKTKKKRRNTIINIEDNLIPKRRMIFCKNLFLKLTSLL